MAMNADARHYRTWRNRVMFYPFGVLAVALGLIVAAAPRSAPPVRIVGIACMAAALWLVRRVTHLGLEVGTKGVTVHGPFRTEHVSWELVVGLGTHRWFANTLLDLDLSDGRKLETNLVQGALVTWHGGKTKDVMSVLQRELDTRGAPSPLAGESPASDALT